MGSPAPSLVVLHPGAPQRHSQIKLYATSTADLDEEGNESYAFVTSNHDDFSVPNGDRRTPHPDIAELFGHSGSRYYYRIDGLELALAEHLGEEFEELLEMSNFQEEPRTLSEIIEAEQEFFDRVWYERSVRFTHRYESGRHDDRDTEESYRVSIDAQERVKARRPDLMPAESDFERGMWGWDRNTADMGRAPAMWNGKLSTLRWVLGSEWDFLDT